jgi:uncharacterized membrane protein
MPRLTDKQLESEIGQMLRIGVILSAIVVIFGGFLYLHHGPTPLTNYTHFHATPEHLRDPIGVLHGVAHLDAESIIQLGILLLIATPLVRVGLCVVGFARQRDRLYVGISAAVLLILIYSLVRGGR